MGVLVSASLLAADPLNLQQAVLDNEQAGIDSFHIDIMDGHFVPNLGFGLHTVEALCHYTSKPVIVHLMVQSCHSMIPMFSKAGAHCIQIHPESTDHIASDLQFIRDQGCAAGVVLNPGTSPFFLEALWDWIDQVLVMTVHPGRGEQTFISSCVSKLSVIRKRINDRSQAIDLFVDGGIDLNTGRICVHNGANGLAVGTSLCRHLSNRDFQWIQQLQELES
jgi:ribulose-phosphate 3-epimerase